MNSRVIKFVAGAGKTTFSKKYLKENKNGIYLAFNNRVVDEIKNKGYLCKTIDSLFASYLIPKFISAIPLIANGSKINYIDGSEHNQYQMGFANIKIHKDGKIYNQTKDTGITLNDSNSTLYSMTSFTNEKFIKFIFGRNSLNINDELRSEISAYIVENYSTELIKLLESRFSYIIIDEAQDLKGYREDFAKLLYESNIQLILLGDDNQNINGGGIWFETLTPDETKNTTFRCTEKICKWIREKLTIEIYGNADFGEYKEIKISEVLAYDNGERVLLYNSNAGKNKEIIDSWKGEKLTIKKSKGDTIEKDIVIVGGKLNKKNLYTAITRTKRNCYSTIKI